MLLLGTGLFLFTDIEEPVHAWGRDYLAFRRVEQHRETLVAAGRESGIDPNFLAAVMVAESSGRVGVVSSAGAMGLFQLSKVTAEWRAELMGLEPPTEEQLLSDPLLNARLGANNLNWLLETYDGDELRALCAYNTGARSLKRLGDAAGGWEAWRAKGEASGRSEILNYAKKVLRYRDQFVERGLFEGELADANAEDGGGAGSSVERSRDGLVERPGSPRSVRPPRSGPDVVE